MRQHDISFKKDGELPDVASRKYSGRFMELADERLPGDCL